jgi:hypothetical protein
MKTLVVCGSCLVLLIIVVVIVGSIIPKRHTASRSAMFRATPGQLYHLISAANLAPGRSSIRDVFRCDRA